jgi:hypothetical protein
MTQEDYVQALASLPLDKAKAVEFAKSVEGKHLEATFLPIITWCTELERLNRGNPANFLLAGAYSEIIYICALIPFCFYRSAYMSLRSVIDELLAYSYYMTHPVELRTAVRKEGFYQTKEDFWSYHMEHTSNFGKLATDTGIATECAQIYSDLSKTVHAQVPDHVCTITAFSDIQFSLQAVRDFLKMQDRTCRMLGVFALIVFRELFRDLSIEAKRTVLKGIPSGLVRRIGIRP